jgi:hypothetical protein
MSDCESLPYDVYSYRSIGNDWSNLQLPYLGMEQEGKMCPGYEKDFSEVRLNLFYICIKTKA